MSELRPVVGRLDLDLLVAFVGIVEFGGFTRAAERLNRTQSAVSMQLKRLEERVGRRLLNRSAHMVQLTEEGQLLFEYARRIVELSEEARMRICAPPLVGSVRLGIPEWYAGRRLQSLLGRFARAHSQVRLEVRADDSYSLRNAIAKGELDLALAIVNPGTNAPPAVHREQLYWVVGRENVPDVSDEMPLALFEPPCPYRDLATSKLEAGGWRWREMFTSKSVASVRNALEAGLAISVFPEGAITESLRVLDENEGFPPLPPTELGIYRVEGGASEPAEQLAVCLVDFLRSADVRHV